METLRLLQVAAEATPFAKAGGLADVIGGLSTELARSGHDIRVIIPDYAATRPAELPVEPVGAEHRVEIAGSVIDYRFLRLTPRAGEPTHYFVHCPAFFGQGGIYSSGEAEAQRFLLLCRAALQLCHDLEWSPQVLHCHDWHTAILPALVRHDASYSRLFADSHTVMTIHNIGYQGIFAPRVFSEAGLGFIVESLRDGDHGDINLLRAGVRHADAITTVSPTYAREILDPAYGMGLEGDLGRRAHHLTGILNGADYRHWDPASDPMIPAAFDAGHPDGKQDCRQALIHELDLNVNGQTPLLGMVSRLVEQKGIDLAIAALPPLLAEGKIAWAILGDGESHLITSLRQLQAQFPDRMAFVAGYDEALAHRIIAGADLLAVPSRYEPCGLTQMYALRYGTVPVVRATGGLADTVTHFDPATGSGNGAVFLDADPGGLRWATDQALAWYAERDSWARLQANGMDADFSWRHQAPHYLQLYQRLLDGSR